MAEAGIACNVHYKPLPMMTAYKNLGFDIANYDTTVIDEYLVQLEQYSKEIYDRIEAMSAQEFSDGLSALRKEVNANEVILRLLSQEDAVSLYSFYFDFFTDNGGSLED